MILDATWICSVVVEPDEGRYYAHCPGLKGIHVDGDTEREALEGALEAVECYITSMIRNNEASGQL